MATDPVSPVGAAIDDVWSREVGVPKPEDVDDVADVIEYAWLSSWVNRRSF